jgi:hemerythrin-like domain-containing protein
MKNIIKTMKEQHQMLRKDTDVILEMFKSEQVVGFEVVEKLLDKFKQDLISHLKLENEVFYPKLLKKMTENNLEIKDTLSFIGEMKVIQNQIYIFLDNFIKNKKVDNDFYQEFNKIVEVLIMRISSEEDGVYIYCDAYGWC